MALGVEKAPQNQDSLMGELDSPGWTVVISLTTHLKLSAGSERRCTQWARTVDSGPQTKGPEL